MHILRYTFGVDDHLKGTISADSVHPIHEGVFRRDLLERDGRDDAAAIVRKVCAWIAGTRRNRNDTSGFVFVEKPKTHFRGEVEGNRRLPVFPRRFESPCLDRLDSVRIQARFEAFDDAHAPWDAIGIDGKGDEACPADLLPSRLLWVIRIGLDNHDGRGDMDGSVVRGL